MNAPEGAFRAKAKRPPPGVKVPVAAPSAAPGLAVAAICCRVPAARGNSVDRGCSAWGSSATAGAGAGALEEADEDEEVGVEEVGVEEVGVEEVGVEEPQPARASAVSRQMSEVGAGYLRIGAQGSTAESSHKPRQER